MKDSFFTSWHTTETLRRRRSQTAAGPDLTSTGAEPKATPLYLSDGAGRVTRYIPACVRNLSAKRQRGPFVRWLDILCWIYLFIFYFLISQSFCLGR